MRTLNDAYPRADQQLAGDDLHLSRLLIAGGRGFLG